VWNEERRQFESGVALRLPPHSKTLSPCRRFMESHLSLLRMHRDHELIYVGRARLRRALIFVAPKEFQGSTESRPTLEFMESPHSLLRTHWDHEPCLVAADVSWL